MVRAKMFYVSSSGVRFGPFTKAEIKAKIDEGKLSLTDSICDDQSTSWDIVLNHPDFGMRENEESKPKPAQTKNGDGLFLPGGPNRADEEHSFEKLIFFKTKKKEETTDITVSRELQLQKKASNLPPVLSQEVEWFIRYDNKVEGPYSYLAIVSMLEQGTLKSSSMVNNSQLGKWKPIAEIPELSGHKQEFKKVEGPIFKSTLSRRSDERKSVGRSMLVYDGISLHKVLCMDVSKGGMSILVRSSRIKSISVLFVMFSPELETDQFDAEVKIMSKCGIRVPNYDEPFMRYGLKFVQFSDYGRKVHQQLLTAEPDK